MHFRLKYIGYEQADSDGWVSARNCECTTLIDDFHMKEKQRLQIRISKLEAELQLAEARKRAISMAQPSYPKTRARTRAVSDAGASVEEGIPIASQSTSMALQPELASSLQEEPSLPSTSNTIEHMQSRIAQLEAALQVAESDPQTSKPAEPTHTTTQAAADIEFEIPEIPEIAPSQLISSSPLLSSSELQSVSSPSLLEESSLALTSSSSTALTTLTSTPHATTSTSTALTHPTEQATADIQVEITASPLHHRRHSLSSLPTQTTSDSSTALASSSDLSSASSSLTSKSAKKYPSRQNVVCTQCGERLSRPSVLKLHIQRVHCDSQDAKLVCENCGMAFKTKPNHAAHLKRRSCFKQ